VQRDEQGCKGVACARLVLTACACTSLAPAHAPCPSFCCVSTAPALMASRLGRVAVTSELLQGTAGEAQ
jgi:hypothetical protein